MIEKLKTDKAQALWHAAVNELDRSYPAWREYIDHMGQVAAAERREAGNRWNDNEVFEALLRAVLSNNTDWAKVESVLPELGSLFSGYDLQKYAITSESHVHDTLVPWFKNRRAGSMTLRRSLVYLIQAARTLSDWAERHGSADDYFLCAIASRNGDPILGAAEIGRIDSQWKLPGFGIPISAEAFRNLGFDICKPDRHICRAVGAFGFLEFRKWPDRSGTKQPQPDESEMIETMRAIERFATVLGERPTFVDNAIWLLCAKMGPHLSNRELASLAGR